MWSSKWTKFPRCNLPVLLYGHFIHYSCSGHLKMSSTPTDQFPIDTTTLSLILKHLPLSTRLSLNRAARCTWFTHTGYVPMARHHCCTPHVQFLARIASHIKFPKCFPLYTKGTKIMPFQVSIQWKYNINYFGTLVAVQDQETPLLRDIPFVRSQYVSQVRPSAQDDKADPPISRPTSHDGPFNLSAAPALRDVASTHKM